MSKPAPFPDLQIAREQAATWIARRERGLDATERSEFDHWIARPAHARAYRQLDSMWNEMDLLEALAQLVPDSVRPIETKLRSRRHSGMLAALIVLGVAALATLLAWRFVPQSGNQKEFSRIEAFATAVGERRSLTLADGSVLTLNSDTVVEVASGSDNRDLRLVRGEVHFAAPPVAGRPFRVTADGRVVQTEGAAFDIRLHGWHGLDILVTEGSISVNDAPKDAVEENSIDPMPAFNLQAGERLEVDGNGRPALQRLAAADVDSVMAWRNAYLIGGRVPSGAQQINRKH